MQHITTDLENRQTDRNSWSTHHVDCCADEDAVVKRPEECNKEADKARNQIDPFKIVFSRRTRQQILTFTLPDWIWFFLTYFYCPKSDG